MVLCCSGIGPVNRQERSKNSGHPAFIENYTIEDIINNFSQILEFVSYKQTNSLWSHMKLQVVELWRKDVLQNVPTDPPGNHCDLTKLLRESQKHIKPPYQQSPYPGNHKPGKINFSYWKHCGQSNYHIYMQLPQEVVSTELRKPFAEYDTGKCKWTLPNMTPNGDYGLWDL